jgi:CRISPR-associated protein Cmr6
MYPRYITAGDGTPQATGEYVELLTIFPDDSNNTQDFLEFLEKDSQFRKLYPVQK